MSRADFLSSLALFQGLSDREVSVLGRNSSEKTYSAGEFIVRETDRAEALFLLREGAVKLTKTSWNGREQTIQFYRPGEMIGLFTLFSGIPFPASAVALEKSTLVVFSRKELEKAAMHEPSLMVNLFFALAMRMNGCIKTVEFLSLKEIPQRLAAFFRAFLDREGKNSFFTLPFSQKELSRVLGTTPETLCRAIGKMTREKIISVKGRKIEVLDISRLEELSEE